MAAVTDVEALTHAYGREIFARLEGGGPVPFGAEWWNARLMEWTMGDPILQVQLFRFVDALPLLHSSEQITQHLREYLGAAGEHVPPWLRLPLHYLPRNGVAGRLLAQTARRSAQRFARRFIAGSNLDEALATIHSLRRQSLAFTVDLLGEATITEAEADLYQAEYLRLLTGLCDAAEHWPVVDLIDREPALAPLTPSPLVGEGRGGGVEAPSMLGTPPDSQQQAPMTSWTAPTPHPNRPPQGGREPGRELPRVNVSIKLSSLYSQFDPINPEGTSAAVRHRLRPILRAAKSRGAFVNIDMEQYAFKDLTLSIFREVLSEDEFRAWPHVGIAIQAYLRDCAGDLERLARWVEQRGTPVWVRLIKGAYWDYETTISAQQDWPVPVFIRKWETDANYEKTTRFLLENRDRLRPAFGSHNVRTLAFVLAQAEVLGLAPTSYELQMLYGMSFQLAHALTALGRRVRIYTPYGQLLPGMAYLVRRLLENTSNESFLRASFTEHVSEEVLLMDPLKSGTRNAECGSNGNSALRTPHSALSNEPLADFSRAESRDAMRRALDEVGGQLGKSYPLVIAGEPVWPLAMLDRVNPSHISQMLGHCGRATEAHARQAIETARQAFPAWRDAPVAERCSILRRAGDVMRRRRFELTAWEVYECGKQWREADADVAEAIDYCNYYAQEMERLAVPQRRDLPGEENQYFYEPRGVVVTIAPWNFPLAILCGMSTAALATGNTVIMKPAEQSSVVAAKLMEVFQEAGLPAGVANYLPGVGEEVGPILIRHPDVAMIAFTGSRGVGLLINREAADTPDGQYHIKRVIAELGGKNAIIVDEDADLDEAVAGVVGSAFGYQGQKCSACSRAIVLEAIHDVFLARLVEATRSLKIAPAEDPGCVIGPVIDPEARCRILDYIEVGKREARTAYAGDVGPLKDEGFYVAPHIFADVPPDARIAQEEIFGPVLAVIRARDLDQALEIANGTPYALTGGLYTRSPQHIARVKREFRVGNLYINRKITGALVDRQPFGGFKLSGMGSKAGGPDYLLQFVLPRTITENTMRRGFAPAQQGGAFPTGLGEGI
jgi:RHH-type proline utilization regulon transcriptional repressor/proline dehydrogenase/delta 1-pyrroline-5-carboxylate dehydrogenase